MIQLAEVFSDSKIVVSLMRKLSWALLQQRPHDVMAQARARLDHVVEDKR